MFILAGALALPAQEPRAGAIQATASPEPLPSKVFVPYSKQRQQEIKRLSGETILGSSIFTCPAQKELPPNGKTETRGGRPVMYTHFHQAGGTTMCRLANQLKNQEKMGDKQRGEQNCNLDADRLVSPQGTSVTCAERIDMCGPYFEGAEMKWRNVTWMQQERWVDGDSCSALYYVAMLRDPLDRIVSNVSSPRPTPPRLPCVPVHLDAVHLAPGYGTAALLTPRPSPCADVCDVAKRPGPCGCERHACAEYAGAGRRHILR